jgi:hypothetical protein
VIKPGFTISDFRYFDKEKVHCHDIGLPMILYKQLKLLIPKSRICDISPENVTVVFKSNFPYFRFNMLWSPGESEDPRRLQEPIALIQCSQQLQEQ